ncbi:Lipocalin-like domain protein (plasmid) [Caballeronia sp. SBC1]|uniref:lipocalin-like domain-containing protein n=1 Tax=unclassified Caballeronia TaxID=2646786 RepID=UPI0013E19FB0|nr:MULTISPECIES: lipocalin-like domain-containing protein [unclassified Caballeronia]QIE26595.1 Lipocalin-like domain protein [Caballeronia sp. SBC2]QIN64089.1 Lipocalin-like domain protein [Caballeronia sp. SBC1]
MKLPAVGQQRQSCTGPQLGTWKLQSFTTEDVETGQKTDMFGAHPSGYLSYGPDGRMCALLVKEGRKVPDTLVPTDAERVELYSGFIAYAGTYSIEGDKVSHHIDASWNQAWTGTTQVRQFKIDGNALYIRTLPAKDPLSGKDTSAVLVWIKVE